MDMEAVWSINVEMYTEAEDGCRNGKFVELKVVEEDRKQDRGCSWRWF